jgi:uncharacterized protein YfdQ (DUF2303 family)
VNDHAINAIKQLVQAIQEPKVPESVGPEQGDPVIVVPCGWEPQVLSVPAKPRRIAQQVALHDAAGFSAYVGEFYTETSAIFFDEDKKTFTGILDYHGGGGGAAASARPEWCDHVATFVAQTTPEWDTWFGKNKKGFGQVEFAEFLEDNLVDVVEPAGASLLEITRTLEAKKDVSYSSAIRLNNGSVRINYDEVVKGSANTQAGSMEIPEQFTLQFQVIRGGSAFRFPARFKYRLKDRVLILWFEIVRPHKILQQALDETIFAIGEATGIPIRKGVAALKP